jgi:hypothetical protein
MPIVTVPPDPRLLIVTGRNRPMTFIQDPAACLDYTVDWTPWLNGDPITAQEWIIQPGIIGREELPDHPRCGLIWLSGGKPGEKYAITHAIRTRGGRRDRRTFLVVIQPR